jgi:RNA recognition motif-containing protein
MNIYVGNLDYKVNEEDLRDVFEEYGNVSDTKIITDKFSGKSKGFGFVVMDSDADANKAINELAGATYENRSMVVNEARERTNNRDRNNSNNRRRY